MQFERRSLPVAAFPARLVPKQPASRAPQTRAVQVDGSDVDGNPPLPNIAGYASVFWNNAPTTQYMLYDDLAERIMPGAFDRALKEDDVRALFNHDPNQLLGRSTSGTLKLSVDRTGLAYDIEPDGRTDVGQAVVAHLDRGDLSGSSFSFIPTTIVWREEDGLLIREIHAVQLFDVGPVTFPAYEATTSGLRSQARDRDGELADVRREMEEWRRGRLDARLARYRHAARMMAAGM